MDNVIDTNEISDLERRREIFIEIIFIIYFFPLHYIIIEHLYIFFNGFIREENVKRSNLWIIMKKIVYINRVLTKIIIARLNSSKRDSFSLF